MGGVRKLMIVALIALVALAAGTASAGNFSPKISFKLSTTKVRSNPSLKILAQQDDREEELAKVQLTLPKGFSIPPDRKIPDGTELGEGTIDIAAGPDCRPGPEGAIPLKQVLPLPVTMKELDRTDEQVDSGIYAVWQLDVTATKINFEITGSVRRGWKLIGEVPPNDNTCTPFVFDMTLAKKAGNVPIIRAPREPGRYTFSATFWSLDSPSVVTLKQRVRIRR